MKLLLVALVLVACCYAQTDDDTLAKNLRLSLVPKDVKTTAEHAIKWMTTMQSDGSWLDVAYKDTNLETWDAAQHVNPRLRDMAFAYYAPGSPLRENATLFSKISLGLDFWLNADLQNPNWWWNDIQMPYDLGQVVNVLPGKLTQEQKTKAAAMLDRDPKWSSMTGANFVWFCMIHLNRGILLGDHVIISDAIANLTSAIKLPARLTGSGTGGMMIDDSFFQHGMQLYSGSYGAYYTIQVLLFLDYTFNTSYAVDSSVVSNFTAYIIDGQQWNLNFPSLTWDIPVRGRMVTRRQGAACKFASKLSVPKSNMTCFDPDLVAKVARYGVRANEWLDYAARLNQTKTRLSGNKMFWFADYMVHSRPSYRSSVKMNAKGLKGAECVNTEGKKSAHFSDGANYLYVTGEDYIDVFPSWDWEKIPGITSKKDGIPLDCNTSNHAFGESTVVGGVSDGNYGAAAMNFTSEAQRLSVLKSWFFFNEEYVALGADLECKDCDTVTTSVAQRLSKRDLRVSSVNNTLKQGSYSFDNVSWMYQGSVGYMFTAYKKPGDVHLTVYDENKVGEWFDIGIQTGKIENDVFGAFIVHDTTVTGSYEYMVVPSTNLDDFVLKIPYRKSKVEISSNSPTVQAVYHKTLDILSAIFWTKGSVTAFGGTVLAKSPCMVLIKRISTNHYAVTASNPSKLIENNIVDLKITLDPTRRSTDRLYTHEGATEGCSYSLGSLHITIPLEGNQTHPEYLGKSTTIDCTW